MESWLLIIRLLLAGIFGLAGVAKFADLKGSKKVFEDFGVPNSLAMPGAVLLSAAEIVIAAGFLNLATSWYAAIAALGLLGLFIVQMAYQLARGNTPDCHCFGQVHSEPVGATSIIRNIIFAALAGLFVWSGPGRQGFGLADPRVDPFSIVIAVGVASGLLYLATIAKRQHDIIRRIELVEVLAREGGAVERENVAHPNEGLPIGAVVPDLDLPDLDEKLVTLDELSADKLPVLFVFVSPSCTPCRSLVPEFEQWLDDLAGKVRLAFVSSGKPNQNREKFGDRLAAHIVLQKDREFADKMKAQWTPTAILMGSDGRVASHAAAGDNAIRHLVEHMKSEDLEREFVYFTNGHTPSKTTKVGQTVPEFSLTDVSGREITDNYLRGRRTLVTFWGLDCSFCEAMIDELRDWEKVRGVDDPQLLVFSDGDPETNQKLGIDAPIVIDEDIAGKLGMFGTPSAVLVNENGVIMSETAMGAADIWSLIGKRK